MYKKIKLKLNQTYIMIGELGVWLLTSFSWHWPYTHTNNDVQAQAYFVLLGKWHSGFEVAVAWQANLAGNIMSVWYVKYLPSVTVCFKSLIHYSFAWDSKCVCYQYMMMTIIYLITKQKRMKLITGPRILRPLSVLHRQCI